MYAAIEGANGQRTDDSTVLALSDEEVFNPLMAVVSVLFVAILLLLLGFWESRKIEEIKQRRIAREKRAKRQKSLKIAGPSSLSESMDDPMWMSERERLLEQQMAVTLDQDIMRSSSGDHKSSTTSATSSVIPHQLTLDMSGRLNEKNKLSQTGDENTVATVEESLDSGCSIWAANDEEDETQDFDAGKSSRGETKKEQSRRLLVQYRKSQSQSAKPKRIKCRNTDLCTIKEEHCIDAGSEPTRVDTVESLNVTDSDDSTEDDRLREIRLFLESKFKSSGRVRRDGSRKRRKPVKIRPPINVFWFAGRREVVRTFAYFILLFSSSAVRYAKFRSNRRFKPGD